MAFENLKGKRFTVITSSAGIVNAEAYRKIPAVLRLGKKEKAQGGFFNYDLILKALDKNKALFDKDSKFADRSVIIQIDRVTNEVGVYITSSLFRSNMNDFLKNTVGFNSSSYDQISSSFFSQIGRATTNIPAGDAYVGILAAPFEPGSIGSGVEVIPPPTCSLKVLETPGIAYNVNGSTRERRITYFNSSSNFTNSHLFTNFRRSTAAGAIFGDPEQQAATNALVAAGLSHLTRSFAHVLSSGDSAEEFYYVQATPVPEWSIEMTSSNNTASFYALTASFSSSADFGVTGGGINGVQDKITFTNVNFNTSSIESIATLGRAMVLSSSNNDRFTVVFSGSNYAAATGGALTGSLIKANIVGLDTAGQISGSVLANAMANAIDLIPSFSAATGSDNHTIKIEGTANSSENIVTQFFNTPPFTGTTASISSTTSSYLGFSIEQTTISHPKFYNDVDDSDGKWTYVVQKGVIEGEGETSKGEIPDADYNKGTYLAFTPQQLYVWYPTDYYYNDIRSASFYFTPYPENMVELNNGATTKALVTGSISSSENEGTGELRTLYWLKHTYTSSFTASFGYHTRAQLKDLVGQAYFDQLPYMNTHRIGLANSYFGRKQRGTNASHLWKDKFLSKPADEGYYVHSGSFHQNSKNQMTSSVESGGSSANHTSSFFVMGVFKHPFLSITDGTIFNYTSSQDRDARINSTSWMNQHTIASCMFLKRFDDEVFIYQASASGKVISESVG